MIQVKKPKLVFHPISEMFTSPTLSADFISKLKLKQISREVMESYRETDTKDIVETGPADARARAYAVIANNDKFCTSNGVALSVVELAAELVQQTLTRLAFVRTVEGAVFTDKVYAFKTPHMYADMAQLRSEQLSALQAFSKIKALISSSTKSSKSMNDDITAICIDAMSECLFILEHIAESKFSPSRSNQIAKSIRDAKH